LKEESREARIRCNGGKSCETFQEEGDVKRRWRKTRKRKRLHAPGVIKQQKRSIGTRGKKENSRRVHRKKKLLND